MTGICTAGHSPPHLPEPLFSRRYFLLAVCRCKWYTVLCLDLNHQAVIHLSSQNQAIGQLSQFFAQMGTVHKTYLDFCRRAVGGTLSRTEIGLLLALTENCNAANDLCRSLPLSKGMISQTLASLQKRGLVVVERSEEDRRVHPITLSPQGEAVVRQLEQAAAAFVGRMMHGVDAQEMAKAESTMAKIHQNMQQIKRTL